MMKRAIPALALVLCLLPAAGHAACYADYKAKRGNPLQLAYGVVQVGGGACPAAAELRRIVADKIGRDGWTLLSIVSTFGEEGLAERKPNAGDNYLRY